MTALAFSAPDYDGDRTARVSLLQRDGARLFVTVGDGPGEAYFDHRTGHPFEDDHHPWTAAALRELAMAATSAAEAMELADGELVEGAPVVVGPMVFSTNEGILSAYESVTTADGAVAVWVGTDEVDGPRLSLDATDLREFSDITADQAVVIALMLQRGAAARRQLDEPTT